MNNVFSVYYLAGPMTGYPQFNFPAFVEAAEQLRGLGMAIVSPAENDPEEVQKAAWASKNGDLADLPSTYTIGETYGRDVEIVADKCNAIIFLPGWEKSNGARVEALVAVLCCHDLYTYIHPKLRGCYAPEIMDAIYQNTV